jgi:NAD(P)-dependent dehydrogenase (short-subunit alcohol dehydrogenase family)
MATLKMAQAFNSHVARSSQKMIVTISSKMGSIAENDSGGSYLYRSSKAAVNMVIKSLAIDLKPVGIIAVVLHPGWVQTDMGGKNALISTVKSVSGMRHVISGLALADSGKFIAYDGKPIPW